MKHTKKISIAEYGMGLRPLDFKDEVQRLVRKEDEVFHARHYEAFQIPELKYPASVKWKCTPLQAFINQMVGYLP